MTLEALASQGKTVISPGMAATIPKRLSEARKASIRESFGSIHNIEHRLERVAIIHGVSYINDSGATRVNTSWFSLESLNTPVIWIAGGQGQGNDYNILQQVVKKKVKALICLGTENENLLLAFSGIIPLVHVADNMWEALEIAYRIGKQGDTVLLSPACPSFDRYENLEERGNAFKAIVRTM